MKLIDVTQFGDVFLGVILDVEACNRKNTTKKKHSDLDEAFLD